MTNKIDSVIKEKLVWVLAAIVLSGSLSVGKAITNTYIHEHQIQQLIQKHEKEVEELKSSVSVLHTRITNLTNACNEFQMDHLKSHIGSRSTPTYRGIPLPKKP